MKAKICGEKCPYVPTDIGENYDPTAVLFVCGRCPESGLLHTATGPFYREHVIYPERTGYFKRSGGHDGVKTL